PPRILDLGPPGSTELDADIKLMSVLGEKDRYVCLSYCWGGTIDIRLLQDRYHDYLAKIPWDILPQGYRDAIQLTRKLGIRYIWIDSLCIVQDDRDDWRKQASLMAQIFQNAYVTIAGTKSRNPNDGYFSTIPHFFSSEGSHQSDFTPGNFPLLTRGWVFQERLLSPRLLHLGDVEVAWECNEVCACECMGETKTYESEPRWAHTKGGHTRNMTAAEDEKDIQPEWRSTVEHYTRTELTYRKDIFPAISGVVKNMKRYRSDRYLAGVWESSVVEDLAWLAVDRAKARPKEWNAPTWSWASVAVPVSYTNLRTILGKKYIQKTEPLEQRTVLVETSVTPAGDDDTAQLTAAHMVLFGPMISARLIADPNTPGEKQHYLAIHDDTGLVFAPDYDLVAEGPSCVPVGSTIYLLHLCQEPKFKNEKRRDTSRKTFALVLRRIHEKDGAGCRTVPRMMDRETARTGE
ncbi:heterokaryon incompatibility protein-domain-containing protein, partial [Ilyonectria robusta]|uniref:heterokaryon incompatibility protein-domain-containing protein n=1 Tax=Ilyonectria robusta TaxID=1079257 RepID=UPI001E8E4EA3